MSTFITPSVVAREALRLLQNELVAVRLFDRRYQANFSGEEKVGDTIRVRRRKAAAVQEFGPADTVSLSFSEPEETSIDIQLEKQFTIALEVTSRELTLQIQDFADQVLRPQVIALVEKVDTYALGKLKQLPQVARPSDSAPAGLPASIADLAKVDQTLNELKAPQVNRWQIISPEYKATLFGINEVHKANERGDNGTALQRASIGRFMNMDHAMGQGVDTTTFTSGTMTAAVVNKSGGVAAGATSIPFDGASGATHTLKAGDIITLAGYGTAVVAADVTASSSAGTITLVEPLRSAVADDAALTVYDGGGNTRQLHGAAFHPQAFSFVSVPLVVPPDATGANMEEDGLSIRVLRGYTMSSQKSSMTLDILCGARVVDGRLGAQIVKNV